MAKDRDAANVRLRDVVRWAGPILGPDHAFFTLAIVYGVGIGLLSLATPISVQMLINSVANIALPTPLFTLSAILFVLLMLSAILSALRAQLMEVFRQRFFAQLVAEITMRAVHARNPFFADERSGDLFNRYFEVMNIQKSVPSLLIGLFTIILQSVVGFAVTSFYHPFFLVFNLLFIALVWLIWRVGSRGAMTSAVALSHAKYDTAHWLESVGASNGFYKSSRHIDFAIAKSEAMTARYIEAYRRHFRYAFSQTVAFLMLYALSSASLLALGGWLIIQGELSIGQLVAAELILSSIFYGVAQFGPYLDTFYDLVAALEELGLLYAIPQENVVQEAAPVFGGDVVFSDVKIGNVTLDCTVPSGAKVVAAADPDTQRAFALLLKRHERPSSGFVVLGGTDIGALDMYQLRSDVIVLDRPTIVESSINEYLRLSTSEQGSCSIMAVLEIVGLDRRIGRLPDGLNTILSSTGWPLALHEVMRLKFAGALLAKPKILVLSPLFELIPTFELDRMFGALRATETTAIYFTNRSSFAELDGYLWLGHGDQRILSDRAEFDALRASIKERADANAR
ncbi:MAG: ABC transporter transmembrane domain-containing protein [Sphingomonadaceae bacterium]